MAIAQNNLGFCYEIGAGTAVNKTEAVCWYKAAARQRYTSAQYNLARCYENGIGTEVNKTEAFRWYKAAAYQGNASARKHLREQKDFFKLLLHIDL